MDQRSKRYTDFVTPQEFLTWLKELIEASAPALAVLLWNYDQSQLTAQKNKTLDAQTNLALEKNHDKVISDNANKSDLDILNDAIASGGSGVNPVIEGNTNSVDPGTKSSS